MPMNMRALRTKVRHNKGLHIDFPYGTRHPNVVKQGEKYWHNQVPHPLYAGLTARAFYYAPEPSTPVPTEFEMYYWPSGSLKQYWSTAVIKGVNLWHHYKVTGLKTHGDEVDKNTTIDVPGYYSLGVRILDKDHFGVLYGENQIAIDNPTTIIGNKWELRMAAGNHYLLSLHLSDEMENSPNYPATQMTSYYLYDPVLGPGSFWIMNCTVVDPAQPLIVYIRLDDAGSRYGEADFPLSSVNPNGRVIIYIRNSRGAYLVTTSVSTETKRIENLSVQLRNHIQPSVSANCQIMTQYCEQAARRT